MAKEFYGFFDSVAGDERVYDGNDFAQLLKAAVKNGITSHGEDGLKVNCDGASLRTVVCPGGCVINGYLYVLSDDGGAPLGFDHVPATGSERWDRIVARLDKTVDNRRISLKLLTGLPGGSAPELIRNDAIYDISLAKIRISPEAERLFAEDIVDERMDEELCGCAASLWMRSMEAEEIDRILNG